MKAEILAIGTEILLGDIVNTNAQYLSQELAAIGVNVYHQAVVGDNEERILEEFDRAFESCDIIFTTGGLGPTEDDLTKELASKYFGKELVLHEPSLDALKNYMKKAGRTEIPESNKKQAYFPSDAIILENPNGTAPGAILIGKRPCDLERENAKDKIIVVMPGPPREMKPMFDNTVKPYLLKQTNSMLKSLVIRVFGIGESEVERRVKHLIENQTNPTIAPYVKDTEAILRITAMSKNEKECDEIIKPVADEIKKILGDNFYGEGEKTIEHVTAKLLIDKKLTISTAESCTGGLLAGTLINYPGISEIFMEGVVTYSNEAKMRRLDVKAETLEQFGAVSEEVAKEMAIGIAKEAGTNIGLSTTGIAGPDGGTEEKPVGLVYIGLYINGKVKAIKCNFFGNREVVRKRSVLSAIDLVRREIK
ncbi:competence/damage-inducible protein A [uncultured Clostridium sp.]|uniref:competence/damage-inducible protein A n=1 Tax=uncultured Clostridium sp. TaxID=59620 RepID=UPI00262A12A4|nr:competence/damage-inducible protein A [uncultured Clostridium sp.]